MSLSDEVVAVPAVVDAPVAEPQGGIGDRLRAAREARGLAIADVSNTLKFSPRQLELVETNAWSELPGQTFIRGCVSTYARFLQLDPLPLLKELESANMPKAAVLALPGSTNARLPVPGHSGGRDLIAVVGGLVLLLIGLAAYFLVPDDFWKKKEEKAPVAAQRAAPAEAPVTPPPAVQAPVPQPGLPAAGVVPAAEGASAPFQRVDPATPGATVLRFEFDQASWVEVRDSNGALVHSQNNAAGTVQEVSGVIPLAVVIGDARRVRMVYKDKPVDLVPFTNPHSNVARLNIE